MDDQRIVELFWQRNEAAITETQKKYGNYCRSIAGNILSRNEDVKEVVNDAYFGAWNAIPPHRPENLSTFLGKIVRRLAMKKLRYEAAQKRISSEATASLDELESCIPSSLRTEAHLEHTELTESINCFLETLKPEERRVFLRRYWFCDSIQSICSRYHYSQSKVKSMLMRTRNKLAVWLRKEGFL
jgi:RNA polymerase sigma factor, sigma-70 family